MTVLADQLLERVRSERVSMRAMPLRQRLDLAGALGDRLLATVSGAQGAPVSPRPAEHRSGAGARP